MDEHALERARVRLEGASAGRPQPAELAAVIERARAQMEELSGAAAGLEAALPEQVAAAVRDGVRREAAPVARQLAEVRGFSVQTIHRLERLETDLTAERHSRVDDLGLLVDLISSGWKSVDERLARIEEALAPRDASPDRATVHDLGSRRAEA